MTTAGGVDTKSFFASSDGVSFHANSFMELHLSRPLLRACEVLGYTKPTPIQVLLFKSYNWSFFDSFLMFLMFYVFHLVLDTELNCCFSLY